MRVWVARDNYVSIYGRQCTDFLVVFGKTKPIRRENMNDINWLPIGEESQFGLHWEILNPSIGESLFPGIKPGEGPIRMKLIAKEADS